MSGAADATHCPSCSTEHRAGFTICTVCGTLLVDGPSPSVDGPPEERPDRGALAFGRLAEVAAEADRFTLEETSIVLTSIVEEDADDFLAALDEQEIGARRGAVTDDGGVEIVVHAANVADAQAVLVEFTGDVTLIDEIGVESDEEMLVVTTARLGEAGRLAARLRAEGIDVRIDLPSPEEATTVAASASILVRAEELARARRVLGIVA